MAPPKGQVKKHKKPLTPLQRKQLKRKNELIQKAKVKSQYYKELNKDPDDDTPDYVKDIFRSERTIDEKGNVVEREVEVDEEQEFDLDQESSSSESDSEEEEEERPEKRSKPNPFKSQLEAFQESQTQKIESKKEKHERIEREKKDRKKYYRERNEQRGKMLARTKKGQPKMANQMDVLLSKIQKNLQNE